MVVWNNSPFRKSHTKHAFQKIFGWGYCLALSWEDGPCMDVWYNVYVRYCDDKTLCVIITHDKPVVIAYLQMCKSSADLFLPQFLFLLLFQINRISDYSIEAIWQWSNFSVGKIERHLRVFQGLPCLGWSWLQTSKYY